VREQDSGLAAGLVDSSFNIGGALGVAILTTVAVSHTKGMSGLSRETRESAITAGYQSAFAVAVAVAALGALLALLLLTKRTRANSEPVQAMENNAARAGTGPGFPWAKSERCSIERSERMERATKTQFMFESEGETLVGDLFLPEAKPAAAVVAVGPLTSVKEQAAGTYAQAMAERGYAALAFDYRYFGESGGRPRQFENPDANIEDIRNAATALLADDRVKDAPLVGLGVCFGAGPMVRAVAEDERFRAFAGVAGVYTDNAKTKARMGDAYQATIERGRAAERTWRETGEAETIPAVAPDGGDVAMPLREAYEFYGTPRGRVPNYVNGYAVQSLAYNLPFDARSAADVINAPVVIVHSEKALTPDLAHSFYAAVRSPKHELWLESQGQIDFYDDPRLISPAADAVAAFLSVESVANAEHAPA
jgi:uncharacterized protein